MGKINLVYCPFPDKKTAEKVINYLLANNLIACANTFQSNSHYKWKGKKKSEKEIITILKVSRKKTNNVQKKLLQLHPYRTPCILVIQAKANKEFYNWVIS
jgi:periplasmic divalent cation tolerance protein